MDVSAAVWRLLGRRGASEDALEARVGWTTTPWTAPEVDASTDVARVHGRRTRPGVGPASSWTADPLVEPDLAAPTSARSLWMVVGRPAPEQRTVARESDAWVPGHRPLAESPARHPLSLVVRQSGPTRPGGAFGSGVVRQEVTRLDHCLRADRSSARQKRRGNRLLGHGEPP